MTPRNWIPWEFDSREMSPYVETSVFEQVSHRIRMTSPELNLGFGAKLRSQAYYESTTWDFSESDATRTMRDHARRLALRFDTEGSDYLCSHPTTRVRWVTWADGVLDQVAELAKQFHDHSVPDDLRVSNDNHRPGILAHPKFRDVVFGESLTGIRSRIEEVPVYWSEGLINHDEPVLFIGNLNALQLGDHSGPESSFDQERGHLVTRIRRDLTLEPGNVFYCFRLTEEA